MRSDTSTPDSVTSLEVAILISVCGCVEDNAAELKSECEGRLEKSRLVVLMDSMGVEKIDMIDRCMGNFDVN